MPYSLCQSCILYACGIYHEEKLFCMRHTIHSNHRNYNPPILIPCIRFVPLLDFSLMFQYNNQLLFNHVTVFLQILMSVITICVTTLVSTMLVHSSVNVMKDIDCRAIHNVWVCQIHACVSICVYVCVHMCMCVHVSVSVYVFVCMCVHVCECICMHVYYVSIYICVCVFFEHACVYARV